MLVNWQKKHWLARVLIFISLLASAPMMAMANVAAPCNMNADSAFSVDMPDTSAEMLGADTNPHCDSNEAPTVTDASCSDQDCQCSQWVVAVPNIVATALANTLLSPAHQYASVRYLPAPWYKPPQS